MDTIICAMIGNTSRATTLAGAFLSQFAKKCGHTTFAPRARNWAVLWGAIWMCVASAKAQSLSDFQWKTNNGTITITDYLGAGGAVSIPTNINGYTVTDIGYAAFYPGIAAGAGAMTSLTIPYTVTTVGVYAFYKCTNLTSLSLSSGLLDLETNAFEYCGGLKSVDIPSSVTNVGDFAFYGCTALTTGVIENGATKIGQEIFSGCTNLVNATVPSGQSNGLTTFYQLTSVANITIAQGSTNILAQEFSGMPALQTVNIASSVKSIGYAAFTGDPLVAVTIPGNVTSLGQFAFYGCTNLASATLGNGVATIGPEAFYNCSALSSISIPTSVSSIGDEAFLGCSNLVSVVIPNGQATVGNYVFQDCPKLTSVTLPGGVAAPANLFGNDPLLDNITIAAGSTAIPDNAYYQFPTLTRVTIPPSVTSIGNYAFGGSPSLTSVTLSSGLTSIGDGAFYNDTNLTSIVIPASVTAIGQYAFYQCSSLTSVVMTNGVQTIGDEAFEYCARLGSIDLPGSITYMGQNEFLDCYSLSNVVLESGVAMVGNYQFYNCTNLTSIVIPASVQMVNVGAFFNCSNLVSATIASGVGTLSDYAFRNCVNLSSINIPGSVTNIGQAIFVECTNMTSATLGNGVPNIPDYTFEYCTNLASVSIPPSVTNIGNVAFYACQKLASIYTGTGTTSIGEYAFDDDVGLHTIVINGPVTNMGDYAFTYCTNATTLVISGGVTQIGNEAFYYCPNLGNGLTPASVTIPASVTNIGTGAFDYCFRIRYYNFYGNAPAVTVSGTDGAFLYDRQYGGEAYYLKGTSGWGTSFGGPESTNSIPTSGTFGGGAGSLTVKISPADVVSAGAQWQVDGGAWQTNGATVGNLSVGPHVVAFSAVSGWITPANLSEIVAANKTTSASVTYKVVPASGTLQVTIAPQGAITAGAKWRVDNGPLQNSGAKVNLLTGSHTVSYSTIAGWTAPARQTATVLANNLTSVTGTYVYLAQTGSVAVTISPAAAVAAGAGWQVDGGAVQKSGATVTGLSVGNHTISYVSVGGWTSPANATVSIANKATSRLTGTYNFTAKGNYNGLFYPGSDISIYNSGMVSSLAVTAQGGFSGKLYIGASPSPVTLSGSFGLGGTYSNVLTRTPAGVGSVILDMTVNYANTPPTITGTVSSASGAWKSPLTIELSATGSKSAEYTALITDETSTNPPGYGYILITNKAGAATLTVAMADGATFTQTVPVSGTTDIPLYGSLYGSTGFVIGWLSLASNDVAGDLTWIKKASAKALMYTAGFTNAASVSGGVWVDDGAPTGLNGETLAISGGFLLSPLDFDFSVSTAEAVTSTGGATNLLSGTVNPKTGLITLNFGTGVGAKTTAGYAAIIQSPGTAGGFFATTTNAGTIYLSSIPNAGFGLDGQGAGMVMESGAIDESPSLPPAVQILFDSLGASSSGPPQVP